MVVGQPIIEVHPFAHSFSIEQVQRELAMHAVAPRAPLAWWHHTLLALVVVDLLFVMTACLVVMLHV